MQVGSLAPKILARVIPNEGTSSFRKSPSNSWHESGHLCTGCRRGTLLSVPHLPCCLFCTDLWYEISGRPSLLRLMSSAQSCRDVLQSLREEHSTDKHTWQIQRTPHAGLRIRRTDQLHCSS